MNKKIICILIGIFVFIVSLVLYIKTLAPTVWFIDSGELAAVCTTLGIAHPTGYPLFTLIGHLFTILPLPFSEVYKLNLMNAFLCPLAVFVFLYLMRFILSSEETAAAGESSSSQKRSAARTRTKATIIPNIVLYGLLLFSCLMFAFSRTVWGVVRSGKVYPLHVFFVVTMMLLLLKAILSKYQRTDNNSDEGPEKNRYYTLFAFVLGLSFTNHLTTILLAPACLTLFLYEYFSKGGYPWKLIVGMIIFFILGFSVYVYLPVRDNMGPIFIWGDPYNLERFWWHFTAKQFNVWIFSGQGSVPAFLVLIGITIALSVYGLVKQKTMNPNLHFVFFVIIAVFTYIILSAGTDTVQRQFQFFWSSIWMEFGTGIVLISIPGIYRLSRFNVRIYYFTLLMFFSCIFYAVNYDIFDIYSYFLLAYVTMVIWICFGALFVFEVLKRYIAAVPNQIAYSTVLLLICLVPLITNYEANDESKNNYVEQYTMNIFNNVDTNAIIISSQWDFWVSASWYYQFVKHIRPDIVVIDKELLRRSWYFKYIQHTHPEIYRNSSDEIEKFKVELSKFEHGLPYDQQTISQDYFNLMSSFVKNNPNRKFYSTWEIEQNKSEPYAVEYARIPVGLLYQLVNKSEIDSSGAYRDYVLHDFNFTPIDLRDYYYGTLMYGYSGMLTNSAKYLASIGRYKDADRYLKLALKAYPTMKEALDFKYLLSRFINE